MGFGSTPKHMHSVLKSHVVNCNCAPGVRVGLRSCELREPKNLQSNEEKRKKRKKKEPPCKSRTRGNVGRCEGGMRETWGKGGKTESPSHVDSGRLVSTGSVHLLISRSTNSCRFERCYMGIMKTGWIGNVGIVKLHSEWDKLCNSAPNRWSFKVEGEN